MTSNETTQNDASYGCDVSYDCGDRKGNSRRQMSYSAEAYNLGHS